MLDVHFLFGIDIMKFSGSCTGMVIRTGDLTVMGRIAALGKLDYFLLFVDNRLL
jgi:hypothetical protein